MKRARSAAPWAAPLLLALVLYWPTLESWFQKDDFVWLNLRNLVHTWRDLGWALFTPLAQGTIRTLSERLFFISFFSIFGLHALPYHCWSFLIFAATLPLMVAVSERLTGSRAAGFWAAILWTVSAGVAVTISWIAINNELLCAFCLLLSLWLLMRYVETGRFAFYIAQCAVFVLGFGVLELNVVYPALAAVYALCCARHLLGKIATLFVVSAAYSVAHVIAAPLPAGGPYKMYWDRGAISTLWTYWKWAMGPRQLIFLGVPPSMFRSSLTALLTIGMVVFLIAKLRRRQWVAAFFPAWFVIVLAPLLPLRDHMDLAYLTIPAVGLAMWGGWALASSWSAGSFSRYVGVILAAVYLCVAIPVARVTTVSFYDGSQKIRAFVLGVVAMSRAQPQKTVFLTGVAPELFWSAMYHRPFRLFGVGEPYLAQSEKELIALDPQTREFFAEPLVEKNAFAEGRALFIDASDDQVRDVTQAGGPQAPAPSRLDVGSDAAASQLGPTWYPIEHGFRWMPKRATLELRGSRNAAERLYLSGFCPEGALGAGPLRLKVSVEAYDLAPVTIHPPGGEFSFSFTLPPQLVGRPTVYIVVEADRTFLSPPDSRPRSIRFGVFEIR